MNQDLDRVAKFEKAIKDKYGEEAIQNPKKNWGPDKEDRFLNERKQFYSKIYSRSENSTIQKGDYKVSEKFYKNSKNRQCPVCDDYLFSNLEFGYITKYGCCKTCYINFVEGREERWKAGWRPE